MKVKVWGARGSVPAPGPKMNRYGGNTSSVQVTSSTARTLILDAGTGIRTLGLGLATAPRINILLTHLHLDHIQGLMFFPPCFRAECRDHDLGPGLAGGVARGPGRALHLCPALPGRGARAAVLGLLPRHRAHRVADRLGDDPSRGRHSSRADAWLSDRRRGHHGLLHPRPRAGPRGPAGEPRRRSGSRATTWRATPTCCSTTASTPTRSTPTTSAGATRRSPTR